MIYLSDEDKKSYVLLSETEDLSDVLSMVRLAETSESYVHRFVLYGFGGCVSVSYAMCYSFEFRGSVEFCCL